MKNDPNFSRLRTRTLRGFFDLSEEFYMSIYFDSKDLQCKNPFGAVLCGTEVSFSLLCSREEDI